MIKQKLSRECFLYRVGLNRYKNQDIQQTNIGKVQAPPPPPPPIQPKFEIQALPPPPTHAKVEFHAPPPTPVETKEPNQAKDSQILVIRVPRELAARALEIALNNGKTNIQVEFTD